MAVTKEDVLKIAKLAHLKFEEKELDPFTEQFQRILAYVEKLNELDTSDVEPTSHVTPHAATADVVLREDYVRTSLSREDVLANAPDRVNGMFGVPKVIQEG